MERTAARPRTSEDCNRYRSRLFARNQPITSSGSCRARTLDRTPSAPEHQMPAPFERLRDCSLRRLGFLTRGERPDALHQIAAEPAAEFVRLARRELPTCFVLREAVFRCVGGLADVKRCEGTGLRRAGAREFDDVDRVGTGAAHRRAVMTTGSSGSRTAAAAPLPPGVRRRGSRTPTGGTPPGSDPRDNSRLKKSLMRQKRNLCVSIAVGRAASYHRKRHQSPVPL